MKKIKYFIILLSLTFVTCDDFVEVAPVGETDADFFNTAEEYESALIGAYDLLQATFWNVMTSVVASDDFGSGGDPSTIDQVTLQNVNYMKQTPADNNQLRDIWTLMYAGLNRSNFILENRDKLDFSGKEQLIAETLFLRAYYAFELAKFYGNVPLKFEEKNGVNRITDQRVFPGDQFTMVRPSSLSAMYGLIQEDLKEAILNLPTSQSSPYRATKAAGQALLGKVYLFDGKYNEAAIQLNDVVSSNQFSLVSGNDYGEIFLTEGENGSGSVFEIQYTNVEGAGWGCLACSEGSYFVQFNGPRSPFDDPVYAAGWGFMLPSQALYDSYEAGDLRKDVTIHDLTALKALDDKSVYSSPREDTGYYNQKYMPRRADRSGNASQAELTHGQNYRAIRFADVLLMAAEANLLGSSTLSPQDLLDRVRDRAFGDTNHRVPATLENILNERRIELAGEGHRYFDLVRTGNAKAAFDAYNTNKPADFDPVNYRAETNGLFPIPLIELELANALETWGQNPGY